jgi:hypothetical protein
VRGVGPTGNSDAVLNGHSGASQCRKRCVVRSSCIARLTGEGCMRCVRVTAIGTFAPARSRWYASSTGSRNALRYQFAMAWLQHAHHGPPNQPDSPGVDAPGATHPKGTGSRSRLKTGPRNAGSAASARRYSMPRFLQSRNPFGFGLIVGHDRTVARRDRQRPVRGQAGLRACREEAARSAMAVSASVGHRWRL